MNDWVLLIDFGTSFSRAAIVDADGRVEPIEVDGAAAMPSGVWADPGGKLIAGLAARRQARLAPERWDRAPKRSLGQPTLPLGAAQVAVPTVVAQVLRQLSAEAIKRRGGKPSQVRLTCSARMDAGRRQTLLEAARLAGLDSPAVAGGVRLIDTPFAASRYLASHGKLPDGATIALFDLGGGGVETAVIQSVEDRVVIRALGGIAGLGGEMFDDLLYQRVVIKGLANRDSRLARRLLEPPDAESRRSAEGLFREIRRAKEELSQSQAVDLDLAAMTELPLRLSRFEVESGLRPEILRSARELAATIELAGLRPRSLDAIYLTGGSSRMPLVSRVIFDVLGVHATELLDESSFLAGAAAWAPQDRIDPAVTPVTTAGRKLEAELPTQPLTEPGGIKLSDIKAALTQAEPEPDPEPPAAEPGPARPVKGKFAKTKAVVSKAAEVKAVVSKVAEVRGVNGTPAGPVSGPTAEGGTRETGEPGQPGTASGAGPVEGSGAGSAEGTAVGGAATTAKGPAGAAQPGEPGQSGQSGGSGGSAQAGGSGAPGRGGRSGKAGRGGKSGRSGQPGGSGGALGPGGSGTAGKPGASGRAAGSREADRGGKRDGSGRPGRGDAAGAHGRAGRAAPTGPAGPAVNAVAARNRRPAGQAGSGSGSGSRTKPGGAAGPAHANPGRSGAVDSRPLWRRPWALAGGALIVVVLVVLAWKFAPSGDGAARALNPAPPAGAASASVTPTVLSTAVGTVTGLTAQAQSTAINLRWNPVAGASSYLVRRDPGQPGEVDLAASQTRFGDRPGDAVPHQYAVVAVDGAGLPGPVGTLVHGTATAPYGARQNIASAWTGIIPPKPAARGSAGQTCRDAVTSDAHATGMIGCRFADGVRLDVLSYATATDRDLRADEVSSEAGVQSAGWTAAPGSRGDPLSGRLLASTAPGGPTAKVAAGPWRWWTFDTAPTYAMYAVWPDHSPQDLGRWWRQKAPFRR